MQNEFRPKWKLKRILASLLALILIPTTLYIAWKYFNRNYYVTSLLVILYVMIPFFVRFEKRKPQARELVTIAVMCAIAVASRAAFIWLDHFKPMAAIVMIAGISLGAETGFLCGALSVLVSNMMFGHGQWTPWQMFAFGMAGFLAGLAYQFKIIDKEKRVKLSLFGAIIIMIFIGPLLDTSTFFMGITVFSKETALTTYLSGAPVNAIHSLATMLTLYFFSGPLFEKLERMKTKYGILEDAYEV